MTNKGKVIVSATVIIGVGLIVWAGFEWPWIYGGREEDEDQRPAAATVAVAPEVAAPQQSGGKQLTYNFGNDTPGQLPAKFHAALTGRGKPGNWAVQADPTALSQPSLLAQAAEDKTDYRFPLAIGDEGSFGDLNLTVKFKPIRGTIDQAGGLVFRLRDPNNYYLVRANALEDNFNFYKVLNGRRSQIKGSRVKASSRQWHELRVEMIGDKVTCYFDGAKQIESTDETFKDAGKIGLWTKADSVSHFDDLQVTAK